MSISITSIFMAYTASDKFSPVVSKGVLLANLVNMHLESDLQVLLFPALDMDEASMTFMLTTLMERTPIFMDQSQACTKKTHDHRETTARNGFKAAYSPTALDMPYSPELIQDHSPRIFTPQC